MRGFPAAIRYWLARLSMRFSRRAEIAHEAATIIELEGPAAYLVARRQAELCDSSGSRAGYLFWTKVAEEIARQFENAPYVPADGSKSE